MIFIIQILIWEIMDINLISNFFMCADIRPAYQVAKVQS